MATTGLAPLPDVGELSYNTVVFSALFHSTARGAAVPDNANRTTKCVEWTVEADGVATLTQPPTAAVLGNIPGPTIDDNMVLLRRKLEAQGGQLVYKGRGLGDLTVNAPGGLLRDVAWGPIPKLLDFRPLGAGRSAQVRWSVTTRIPEVPVPPGGFAGKNRGVLNQNANQPNANAGQVKPKAVGVLLQFNEDLGIRYDEDGYSSLSLRGTMEMPMTRTAVTDRSVAATIDDFRQRFLDLVSQVDLTRYRVVGRDFNVSRDRRTMEWEFQIQELAPMGLPPGCLSARGSFACRPLKQGVGLMRWLCSLRCTYTVRKDAPRRVAWLAFISLLKFRMEQSERGNIPLGNQQADPANQQPAPPNPLPVNPFFVLINPAQALIGPLKAQLKGQQQQAKQAKEQARRAMLVHFGLDEGLYLDSKTVTFEASWRLLTTFSHILLATGVWRSSGVEGGRNWAASVQNIQGWKSWLANRVDPGLDFIVDLGDG